MFEATDDDNSRENWTFDLNPSLVMTLIKRKKEFHETKVTYWTTEMEKAEEFVKETKKLRKKLDINDDDQFMDNTDRRRLNYCKSKLTHHTSELDKTNTWGALVSLGAKDMPIPFTYEDAVYFGVKEYIFSRGGEL